MNYGRLVIVALGASALTAVAVSSGIAAMARRSRPELALSVAPWDAKAHEERADKALSTGLVGRARGEAERDSRMALRRSPLSPVAARTLGFAEDLDGHHAVGRQLVLQAAMLTRRDLSTRLWLIEDAVARQDVAGALDQFDIALRRSRTARDLLFPILGKAAAEPQLVGPITKLLSQRPNWSGLFLQTAIAQGDATENVARMLARLPDLKVADGDLRQQVVQKLVGEKKFAAARRAAGWYSKAAPAAVSDRLFKGERGYLPFTWDLASDSSRGAVLGEGLRLSAVGGDGGVVATQVLTLAPGPYQLSIIGQADARGGGRATWTIRCNDPSSPAQAELRVPPTLSSASTAFRIPEGCAGQYLTLYVSGGSSASGMEGQMRMIDVTPARS